MLTSILKAITPEQKHFLFRRLHSLLGIVPLGGFLFFHLFENSKVLGGPEAFNRMAEEIGTQPYISIVEWFVLFLPILYHGYYGVLIATDAKRTLRHTNYNPIGTLRFYIQRATGIILIAFLAYHVYSTRITIHYLQQAVDAAGNTLIHPTYDFMVQHFHHAPWVVPFYALGITCAAYHLANGIWSFSIVWGITAKKRTQDLCLLLVSAPVFCIVVGMGTWALLHFPKPETAVAAKVQTISVNR